MLVTSFVFNTVTLLSFLPLFWSVTGSMPLAAFPTSTGSGDVLHKEDRVDL